ncbi:MAG: (Fe-S)-binding protein [Bryobacter sp.]|nr:(Fe-S)-binding protein [Bryobacter sp.]
MPDSNFAAPALALSVLANRHPDAPAQKDLDKCVHCGLCLNACPTYRELGVEMDSPRGRIYQMVQVATGAAPLNDTYIEHMDLCLGCRACETACPSGVEYGKLIEAARTEITARRQRSFPWNIFEDFVFGSLLASPFLLRIVALKMWVYQKTGLEALVRATGLLKLLGPLGKIEHLTPQAQLPTFFSQYGQVFPAEGERRHKVALLGGCIANIFFARLHEATVRVLQKNGCEVHVPANQTCCGALHAHAGRREEARALARKNIDALLNQGFDAIISNTGGCGATLKEYHELLDHDTAYHARAKEFVHKLKDVNEFLGNLELNPRLGRLERRVTYQDSCHLCHGQKVKTQPRKLLRAIPGLEFVEMPASDVCCGSAGIYNVVQNEMAEEILASKMRNVNHVAPEQIASSNPGCMIQLAAGAKLHGAGPLATHPQPVKHIVELLDEAYQNFRP